MVKIGQTSQFCPLAGGPIKGPWTVESDSLEEAMKHLATRWQQSATAISPSGSTAT